MDQHSIFPIKGHKLPLLMWNSAFMWLVVHYDQRLASQHFVRLSNCSCKMTLLPLGLVYVPTHPVPSHTLPTDTVPTGPLPTDPVPTNIVLTVPTDTVPTDAVPTHTVPTVPSDTTQWRCMH